MAGWVGRWPEGKAHYLGEDLLHSVYLGCWVISDHV